MSYSTSQIFLPFFNPSSVDAQGNVNKGWFFGLPIEGKEDSQHPDSACRAVVLLDDGSMLDYKKIHFRYEQGTPSPIWGWPSFSTHDGTIINASLTTPKRMQGSIPLEEGMVITPQSTQKPQDVETSICAAGKDGWRQAMLGKACIASYYVDEDTGYVTAIEPAEDAYQLELWSSHVFRVVQVLELTRQNPQEQARSQYITNM